ncbi:MAG: acyl carrier protein [Bacteroidetes bacterium]|nr:acyl carrier protein [Bacteroidota bacterium]
MIDGIKLKLTAIVERLGISAELLQTDPNLFRDAVLDSMLAIDYIIEIEREFGVKLDIQAIGEGELGKISDMAEYIGRMTKTTD